MSTLDSPALAADRPADWSAFARLSVMMFLQFFVWGAWYVTTGNYMVAKGIGGLIPWAYSVSPIAAIVAPFFVGMFADRFFATERILAAMHLLGAIAIGLAPWAANQSGGLFIVMLLVHMLCYMPTINLTNTISFRNMTNQEKQFPYIRAFGTVGWIAANFAVGGIGATRNQNQYYLAAGAGVLLAVFSLFLPHTPPPARGKQVTAREVLGLDALSMLRQRSYLVFMICAMLICIPLAVYYNYTSVFVEAIGNALPNHTPTWLYDEKDVIKVPWLMLLGQIAEVLFMLLLPFALVRWGFKWVLAVGMAAWVLRYGLFAAAAPSAALALVILGILLHGICYDFFFVTGFIYTDKRSPKEISGQAQGLLVLATYGVGMLVGAQLSGLVFNRIVGGDNATDVSALINYQRFWLFPCAFALVILIAFLALFRDDSKEPVVSLDENKSGFEVIPPARADAGAPG
jgi:nucleoside transporter